MFPASPYPAEDLRASFERPPLISHRGSISVRSDPVAQTIDRSFLTDTGERSRCVRRVMCSELPLIAGPPAGGTSQEPSPLVLLGSSGLMVHWWTGQSHVLRNRWLPGT